MSSGADKAASFAARRRTAGDLVNRELDDVWRIVAIAEDHDPLRDTALCVCERPSPGWLRADGMRAKSWSKVGDEQRFFISDLKPIEPQA
jgi:hypothetical protein